MVTNILMGFIIWSQVGGGGTSFSNFPYLGEFSNILSQKSSFSFWFSLHSSVLSKIFKTLFLIPKLKKKIGSKRITFFYLIEFRRILGIGKVSTFSVPSEFRAIFTRRGPKGRVYGWMEWMDGRSIKSLLHFFLYFVGI